MTATSRIWEPTTVGEIPLEGRLAMAPTTRDRSTTGAFPAGMNAEYYAQRASTGLIVTEGTQLSDDETGYLLGPGIYTDGHIAGLRVAVGAMVLASPDPVDRIKTGAALDEPDRGRFYGGDRRGCTDYPTLPTTLAVADRAA